jgi:hypothetical protein
MRAALAFNNDFHNNKRTEGNECSKTTARDEFRDTDPDLDAFKVVSPSPSRGTSRMEG